MSHSDFNRSSGQSDSFVRVNGKIRAREVRVVGEDGKQMGIMSLNDALALARSYGVDLVEIAPNANPPVCKLIDYGKYKYEQAKKEKDAKKHQHAGKVKEIQLSPNITQHDLQVKLAHAIDFLCDDMKVKVTLMFKGREMAHTEYGFDVVKRFINELAPYGRPDNEPKLVGRGINVIITPLPRNKRAKNPRLSETEEPPTQQNIHKPQLKVADPQTNNPNKPNATDNQKSNNSFVNNPFTQLDSSTNK